MGRGRQGPVTDRAPARPWRPRRRRRRDQGGPGAAGGELGWPVRADAAPGLILAGSGFGARLYDRRYGAALHFGPRGFIHAPDADACVWGHVHSAAIKSRYLSQNTWVGTSFENGIIRFDAAPVKLAAWHAVAVPPTAACLDRSEP